MKLLKSKKGELSTGTISTAIESLILLVVLFLLYANLVPEAQTAGNELNASGVPLGSLFVGGGVVFVIIMASLIMLVIKSTLKGKK